MGRIRAIPIADVGSTSSLRDIRTFISVQDNSAINDLKYQPWYIVRSANFREKDPYLCDSFLPKNIGLIPNPGQLVKIITYTEAQSKEFLGPFTIDQLTLTDEYRNVVRNLQKGIDISQVLPKLSKTFISGYNSEQFMLGDNEAILRLAHVDTNKTRKDTYPFQQLTQFSNSYTIINEQVNTVQSTDPAINYILEFFIDYTPKVSSISEQNITATAILYDASTLLNTQNQLGLTKNTYNQTQKYIDEYTDVFIVKHFISAANFSDFQIMLNTVVDNYKSNSKVAYFSPSGDTVQTISDSVKYQTIITTNNLTILPTAGGGTHDDPTVVTGGLNNWLLRLTPGTSIRNYTGSFDKPNVTDQNSLVYQNYKNYVSLDTFLSALSIEQDFGALADNNETIIVSNQDVSQSTGIPQSVYSLYTDKMLFLSSIVSPSLVNDTNTDGFNASQIAEFLYGQNQNIQTYGFLRAEPLLNLMIDVLNMLLTHGHQVGVDPTSSIIESSKQDIMDLIKRIQDEKTQGQNNIIVNHNFRIN